MDNTKEHTDTQQILSICYGYGGLERGVSAVVPIKPVAYVEIEAFQNFNLVAAMESGLVDPAPIWTDLKTFDAEPFCNKLHGIIGGYPCQGESLAGKRELWNDDRFLWPYIENIMRTARPLWGFFENVAGHLSGSFAYVLDSLRAMGYKVEAGLYSAEEAGAPHQRKRMFILAEDDTANGGFRKREKTKNENRQKGSKSGRQLASGLEGSGSSELDNSSSYGSEPFNKICAGRNSFEYASKKELGNATSSNKQRVFKQSRGLQFEIGRSSEKELANSNSIGSEQSLQRSESRILNQNGVKWPAPRGHQQFDWEAQRTVKPGLGCTVNGYNFRTELLRQYGNGVVSQTAEIAFRDLINKI